MKRKLAHATYMREENGIKSLRYHDTDVVVIDVGRGHYTLNSGGWRTKTTKDRINAHINGYINQDKGVWYYNPPDGGQKVKFTDGMVIDTHGDVVSGGAPVGDDQRTKELRKGIKRLVDMITEDNLPVPADGDCLICKGIFREKTSCLEIHVEEGYLHGSLLVNAMRHSMWDDGRIALHYQIGSTDIFRRALRKYLNHHLIR